MFVVLYERKSKRTGGSLWYRLVKQNVNKMKFWKQSDKSILFG